MFIEFLLILSFKTYYQFFPPFFLHRAAGWTCVYCTDFYHTKTNISQKGRTQMDNCWTFDKPMVSLFTCHVQLISYGNFVKYRFQLKLFAHHVTLPEQRRDVIKKPPSTLNIFTWANIDWILLQTLRNALTLSAIEKPSSTVRLIEVFQLMWPLDVTSYCGQLFSVDQLKGTPCEYVVGPNGLSNRQD